MFSHVLTLLAGAALGAGCVLPPLLRQLRRWQHDPLTGLPVRRRFEEQAPRACRRAAFPVVVFIDLDGFKAVNNRGYDQGDAVLAVIGRRIHSTVRRGGSTVARLGGDEFVLILDEPDHDVIVTTLNGLLEAIKAPIDLPAAPDLRVGASIGAVRFTRSPGLRLSRVLNLAEQQMRAIKRAGGGVRVIEADPADARLTQKTPRRPWFRDRHLDAARVEEHRTPADLR